MNDGAGPLLYLLAGEPQKVNHWLGVAAKEPRTFYGLLALHNLGLEPPLVWKLPSAGSKGFDEVLHDPAGKRAIALIEAHRWSHGSPQRVNESPQVCPPGVAAYGRPANNPDSA